MKKNYRKYEERAFIGLSVEQTMKDELIKYCERHGTFLSEAVRRAIEKLLDEDNEAT